MELAVRIYSRNTTTPSSAVDQWIKFFIYSQWRCTILSDSIKYGFGVALL